MADPCLALRCGDLDVCLGQVPVVRGASFACCEGAWVVIGGPIDADRSRLLRAVDGLCPPSGGRIWAVSRELALLETQTGRGNVELEVRGGGGAWRDRRAEERLECLVLERKLHELAGRRAGHGRQRAALARALAPRPRPLILDEPMASLQRPAARIVMEAVRRLVDAGAIVVMPDGDAEVEGAVPCLSPGAGARRTAAGPVLLIPRSAAEPD